MLLIILQLCLPHYRVILQVFQEHESLDDIIHVAAGFLQGILNLVQSYQHLSGDIVHQELARLHVLAGHTGDKDQVARHHALGVYG
ncbi:hypothetical protein ES703_82325 [subsurface metagenome]